MNTKSIGFRCITSVMMALVMCVGFTPQTSLAAYGTTLVDSTVSHVQVSPQQQPATGTTSYSGTAQVLALADTTLGFQVAYGLSSTNLDNITTTYLANSHNVVGQHHFTNGEGLNIGFELTNLTNNTQYYYAYVDGSDASKSYTSVMSFTLGNPSSPNPQNPTGTLVDTAAQGFYITAGQGGANQATSYIGNGEIISSRPVTVAAAIIWGETPSTMTNNTGLYLAGSTLPLGSYVLDGNGDKVPVSFKLDGLTTAPGGKTYYYAYVKASDPNIRYSDPISVLFFGSSTGASAGTTTANGTAQGGAVTGIATVGTPQDFSGGLVPCSGDIRSGNGSDPCTFKHLLKLINNVINFLILLIGPIIAIIVCYVGFLYMTSGGSEEARGKAKTAFWHVVLGTLAVLGAWLIINTILTTLGVSDAYKLF
jgi:hypothetical protein